MAQALFQLSTVKLLITNLLQGEVEVWRNTGWAGVKRTTAALLTY